MIISHLSGLLISTVHELGRNKSPSISSFEIMNKIRDSLFTTLEDPSITTYLPFIEVLIKFISEHPDFYTNEGFYKKTRISDISYTGDQIRKISTSLLSNDFKKKVLLDEGFRSTTKLYSLFEEHLADLSLSDIYDSENAFQSLLMDIYTAQIPLSSLHLQMIIEAGKCMDNMYFQYKQVLMDIYEQSGIKEEESVEIFDLEKIAGQKGDINFYFWMKTGKESILKEYFRALYRADSLNSWISSEVYYFGKSQDNFKECINMVLNEEDIDEDWILSLFASTYHESADNKMYAMCHSIYLHSDIPPLHIDLTSRKPAIFLEYNDIYGYGNNLSEGYYDKGPYIFIRSSGSTDDEYDGIKDHEFSHYLYENVFNKIRSSVSGRIGFKTKDQGEDIFILKNKSSRGFSHITPEWIHVQDELCAYIGQQNIIPTYLPYVLGDHFKKKEFSVELLRLIIDLFDIILVYPESKEDIISTILTSPSIQKLRIQLHIMYDHCIENTNLPVSRLIEKFLEISPEKQIEIYPYNIYIDYKDCIVIDHIESGETQIYRSVKDIPESIFPQ